MPSQILEELLAPVLVLSVDGYEAILPGDPGAPDGLVLVPALQNWANGTFRPGIPQ